MQEEGAFLEKSAKRGGYRRRVRRRDGAWQPASFIAHAWSILWRKDAGRLFWKKRGLYVLRKKTQAGKSGEREQADTGDGFAGRGEAW